MSKAKRFLAFDFGAESGRAVVGTLAKGSIHLEEIHRFPTEGLVMLGTRQWDITRIYTEMLAGLSKYVKIYGSKLDGIGIDTWGVDFGLVARDGTVLGNPTHYRDRRTTGMYKAAFEIVPREEIYNATGICFMEINTAYQLLSMVLAKSPLLDAAESLLMMDDLFAYLLCGKRACEFTNATTSQLVDMRTGTWNDKLVERLGLPRRVLLDPTPPGTVLGKILPEVAAATGLSPDVPVIAVAGHDTADAAAAVPSADDSGDWAFLSSGTWSLMGAELDKPLISHETLAGNFTNEGGVCGKILFMNNITGLWIVQECRRAWHRKGEKLDYTHLTAEAAKAKPFAALVNVDDPGLMAPDDMPTALRELSAKGGFSKPRTHGAVVRCALESLALRYRRTLKGLDKILGRTTSRLHIIGGGIQNRLLCQMAADACGIEVLAGPVEATALGNIALQAMAVGEIDSLASIRRTVAQSFPVKRYKPSNTAAWEKAEAMLNK